MNDDLLLRAGDVLVRRTTAGAIARRYRVVDRYGDGRLRLQPLDGGPAQWVHWESVRDLPKRWERERVDRHSATLTTYEIRTRVISGRVGARFNVRDRIDADSAMTALRSYLAKHPRLVQDSAIAPTARPDAASVTAILKGTPVTFVAWPAK